MFDSVKKKRVMTTWATPFKRTLLLLNIAFLIISLLVAGLGVFALVKLYHLTRTLPICIIVLGSFVFFLTFFGCWGAARNNKNALLIYFMILLFLMIGEAIIGFIAIHNKNNVKETLQSAWDSLSDDERNLFQEDFKCCGFFNVTDQPGSSCVKNNDTDPGSPSPSPSPYILSPSPSQSSAPTPEATPSAEASPSTEASSTPKSKQIRSDETNRSEDPTPSCYDKLSSLWDENMILIAVAGVVFASFQAIGLVFSLILYFCIVCCSWKEEEVDPYQYDDLSMRPLTTYEDGDSE